MYRISIGNRLLSVFINHYFAFKVKRSIMNLREDVSRDIWKTTNDLDVIYPNVSHPNNTEWVKNITNRMRQFEMDLIKKLR